MVAAVTPLRYYTADVFTDRPFCGNPLAVFPEARALSDAHMQNIARELNLAETAFVFAPSEARHTNRLRIFTPKAELPFAGHPTVGTAFVLAATGRIALTGDQTDIVFEENVGPVPVRIRSSNGAPSFMQLTVAQLPEAGPPPPETAALAAALSLPTDAILAGEHAPQAYSCGLPYLFVPLRDRAALSRARLQRDRWEALLARYWAPHLYLITFDTGSPYVQVRARMYAPAIATDEDPATGSAAAALAGYLGARATRKGTLSWRIEQGVEMGRPSLMEVEADKINGNITAVRVGGAAVLMSEAAFMLAVERN